MRIDSGVYEGAEISMYYDPMIAKVIGSGADRREAIGALSDAFAGRAFLLGDFVTLCPGGAAPAKAVSSLQAACSGASSLGIRHALIAVSMLFAWGGIHYFIAARDLRRDLETHYRAPRAAE